MAQGPQVIYSREEVERAARIYRNCHQAAEALGISPASFNRLCRRHNVTPPQKRPGRKKGRS